MGKTDGKKNKINSNCISNYRQMVQLLSHVQLFAPPWTVAHQASLSITNSQSLLKLIHWVGDPRRWDGWPSNHLIFCCPLLLLPSIFPSIRVFSSESILHIQWSKYSSFSISPSNEYLGLISFRMDWLDLLVVQGTLKSLLQHHSSKESIVWHSAFFMVQLSHPYVTPGRTIVLIRSITCKWIKVKERHEDVQLTRAPTIYKI